MMIRIQNTEGVEEQHLLQNLQTRKLRRAVRPPLDTVPLPKCSNQAEVKQKKESQCNASSPGFNWK
jgi:hypothetical protein